MPLTCDQEGAAAGASLVGDVTGVLAVTLAVQRSDQVGGVVAPLAELAHGEEAGPQLPLVAQEAGRVSPQQAAREAERPAESLTHLRVRRLHRGRDCREERHTLPRSRDHEIPNRTPAADY